MASTRLAFDAVPTKECIEAMSAEEKRLGRKLSQREREAFARGFHAPEYRAEIGRLMALGVEPPDEDKA